MNVKCQFNLIKACIVTSHCAGNDGLDLWRGLTCGIRKVVLSTVTALITTSMLTFSWYLELPRDAAIGAFGDNVLMKVGRDHDYISFIIYIGL